jgi:aerobic carbon-monoxide dehydrogenase small subunit
MKELVRLTVNDEAHEIAINSNMTLLELIRDELGLMGTKKSCNHGECGSCTVLVEGKPLNSCLVLAIEMEGKRILTIEGLAKQGKLHPLQEAFIKYEGFQCGFCTPGMILSAKALLDENPHPSEMEIKEAISGNLCRCTGYVQIVEAIKAAALSLDREDRFLFNANHRVKAIL